MELLPVRDLIAAVEQTVSDSALRWVLFSNGTFVILDPALPAEALEDRAREVLALHGPVHPGSGSADFSVAPLARVAGWAVSSQGPGLFTYVHPAELGSGPVTELAVGLLGRDKRALDARDPCVLHVHAPQQGEPPTA
ncbi:hypothetical protein [Roseateles flavus]|uniref:Uncharacterized protein n=1 Tax=Roseateles flavus TaxID=3149041 RepID=A0ABV0GGS9_9BURK